MGANRLLVVAVVAVLGCVTSIDAQEWVPGVGAVCTPAQLGRLGLVRNVHAYDQNGVAVAPVRCIAELLGAQVEYKAPNILIRSTRPAVTISIGVGSRLALVNGREMDMGSAAMEYSGITCIPIRFFAQTFGGRIDYHQSSAFGFDPAIEISMNHPITAIGSAREGARETSLEISRFYLLPHRQPPVAVARIIADLEYTRQIDELSPDIAFDLERYGVQWVLTVGALGSDGLHFRAGCPAIWEDDIPYTEEIADGAFTSYAYGVYRRSDGRWRLLTSGQDDLSFHACDRVGLPYAIARELGVGPADYEEPPSAPNAGAQVQPEVTYFLTLENARMPVHVGEGYFVMGLNFTSASAFTDRGTKVLGQVMTPAFVATDKPVRVEMMVTAFDRDLRVIGSSSLNFHSVSSGGATLPFEATLFSVGLEDLAFVSITPKGAWIPRD